MRTVLSSGAGIALALGLAACGGHPSAVQSQAGQPATSAGEATWQASYDRRNAATPQANGKPMWAANRKHTAGENAQ